MFQHDILRVIMSCVTTFFVLFGHAVQKERTDGWSFSVSQHVLCFVDCHYVNDKHSLKENMSGGVPCCVLLHENLLQLATAQQFFTYQKLLTFIYSTFCPHSEFLCFIWISGQTALIYLYIIYCWLL